MKSLKEDFSLMSTYARENGLLISGGSDFHGSNKPDIALGKGRGHLYIPYSVLETIKAGPSLAEATSHLMQVLNDPERIIG